MACVWQESARALFTSSSSHFSQLLYSRGLTNTPLELRDNNLISLVKHPILTDRNLVSHIRKFVLGGRLSDAAIDHVFNVLFGTKIFSRRINTVEELIDAWSQESRHKLLSVD
jgi:hypothetical protein